MAAVPLAEKSLHYHDFKNQDLLFCFLIGSETAAAVAAEPAFLKSFFSSSFIQASLLFNRFYIAQNFCDTDGFAIISSYQGMI